jgi:hypothetical protein
MGFARFVHPSIVCTMNHTALTATASNIPSTGAPSPAGQDRSFLLTDDLRRAVERVNEWHWIQEQARWRPAEAS